MDKLQQRAINRVNRAIDNNPKAKRILLGQEEWLLFRKAIEPLYKQAYGGLITSPNEDMLNIMYRGKPVCMMDKRLEKDVPVDKF